MTSNTKAIVVISPNNPTGALYPVVAPTIIEVARQHQLIILANEIYDKALYDGSVHTSIASLADDVLCLTFNGLSKNWYLGYAGRGIDHAVLYHNLDDALSAARQARMLILGEFPRVVCS